MTFVQPLLQVLLVAFVARFPPVGLPCQQDGTYQHQQQRALQCLCVGIEHVQVVSQSATAYNQQQGAYDETASQQVVDAAQQEEAVPGQEQVEGVTAYPAQVVGQEQQARSYEGKGYELPAVAGAQEGFAGFVHGVHVVYWFRRTKVGCMSVICNVFPMVAGYFPTNADRLEDECGVAGW